MKDRRSTWYTNTFAPDGHHTMSSCRQLICGLTVGYIGAIYCIAGLKFGTIIDTTGVSLFPNTLIEWIFSPWPAITVPILSSFALVAALLSFRNRSINALCSMWFLWTPTCGLLIASIIGFIRTTEIDYALLFFWHIIGVFNFVLAVSIVTFSLPQARKFFRSCIFIGVCLLLLSGIQQLLYGFDDTKKFAEELARNADVALSSKLQVRLEQSRVYTTFVYPNSYAAHLLVTIPLLIAVLVYDWRRYFASRSVQLALVIIIAIMSSINLVSTGSRAAGIAVVLALLSTIVFYLWDRSNVRRCTMRYAICGGILIIIACVTVYYIVGTRNLASLFARLHYYEAAVKLFCKFPGFGAGMGEFYPWYLRLKPPGAEETRLTHNLFLHFISQSGFLGGVSALIFLLHPIGLWVARLRKRISVDSTLLFYCMVLGVVSWNIHALCDFNIQVPGTTLIVCTLPILFVKQDNRNRIEQYRLTHSTLHHIIMGVLIIAGVSAVWRLNGDRYYQLLCSKYISNGTTGNLVDYTEIVASKLPHSPYPWDLLGKHALSQRDIQTAENAFAEASKRVPHRAAYYAYLAQCALIRRDLDLAKIRIQKAIQWYPTRNEYLEHEKIINAFADRRDAN